MNGQTIKKLLWKSMGDRLQGRYLRARFLRSRDYGRLKHSAPGKRIILLDTPEHGNLGDQAIVIAERQFIQQRMPKMEIYEFSHEYCNFFLKDICAFLNKESDVIVIPGGGFIGTLWPQEHETLIQILRALQAYRIVIFPQTIFFEDSEEGDALSEAFVRQVKACRDITVFTRDAASYAWMERHMGHSQNVRYHLVPDIVTTLDCGKLAAARKKKALLCMRKDKEKSSSDSAIKAAADFATQCGLSIEQTDTVMPRGITRRDRKRMVFQKLRQFSEASLVITDRLHGMIFAAVTSTPCIAIDNKSKKVSGGYQWLKGLGYIRCVDPEDLTIEMMGELIHCKNTQYDSSFWKPYLPLFDEALRDGGTMG